MAVVTATKKLNWQAKGEDRKAQNAANLLAMAYYENAFERTMGNSVVDVATTNTIAVTEEVHRNFSVFMPAANIMDIRVIPDADGDMTLEVDIAYE